MSTEFKPGDRVQIEIREAMVVSKSSMVTKIDYGKGLTGLIPSRHQNVTVTRIVPTPQAGDVWQLTDGTVWQICTSGQEKTMWANDVADGHTARHASDIDFTGADLLFRLPDPLSVNIEQACNGCPLCPDHNAPWEGK